MYIRRLLDDEYEDVVQLITQTVHCVCANDYTQEELDAWAPQNFDINKFRANLSPCCNLAAFEKGKIVGFISIERSGYINGLFTPWHCNRAFSESRGMGKGKRNL